MSEIEKDNEELEEKEGHKKKHHFLNFLIFIVVLLVGCVFYSKYVGIKGLIVKEYRVESSILTENFSGIKIVHFSDLLYKSTVDSEDIKILVNKINELRPDIVVFTGDLVIKGAKISSKDKEMLINELSSIKANIGKYAINGDNDYSYSDYKLAVNKDTRFPSKYAKENVEAGNYNEDFAESISFYLINEKTFSNKYPARTEYIKEIIKK